MPRDLFQFVDEVEAIEAVVGDRADIDGQCSGARRCKPIVPQQPPAHPSRATPHIAPPRTIKVSGVSEHDRARGSFGEQAQVGDDAAIEAEGISRYPTASGGMREKLCVHIAVGRYFDRHRGIAPNVGFQAAGREGLGRLGRFFFSAPVLVIVRLAILA